MRKIMLGLAIALLLLLAGVWWAGQGGFGDLDETGDVLAQRRPQSALDAAARQQREAAEALEVEGTKQILFGDLHVHSTFSRDAFIFSLPLLQGEGAHPPSDACDFARFCSALDFWSINDHASDITPDEWAQTVESIRQCNAVGGEGPHPDTVAFLGWEWTQVGLTPDTHYGHKNVVLAGTGESDVPARPIAASRSAGPGPTALVRGAAALAFGGRIHDLAATFTEDLGRVPCAEDVPTTELPLDCLERAETPADLFRKLTEGNTEAIVIPHGTSWGLYSPPGSRWDKQLAGPMHDPAWQTLIEVYSGHGETEVYRDWRAVETAEDGSVSCPAPRPDYLPSCWHAGELVRERCLAAAESAEECEGRASVARQHAADAGVAIQLTVPGTRAADWLDAGQCKDCREPAFNYRPASSAQYIAALSNFDEEGEPRRFRLGFMASSDNHYARPGTGYKELHRRGFTESVGGSAADAVPLAGMLPAQEPVPRSVPYELDSLSFGTFETERQASFFVTGGLIAAHSEGRSRESIWSAMQRREVYGTSGPRIQLWFDLVNPPGSPAGETVPMGGEVAMAGTPEFEVRAAGSFEQKPGCPDYATSALSPERLSHVCKGECYYPSETRRPITRIEVVRIRPQQTPGEEVSRLIDDPWKRFECPADPAGCRVTFRDPDYVETGRDTLYYVRAFEAPAPAVNGDNVRCERDAEGRCLRSDPCPSPDGSDPDCLGKHEPRAWSSPVYVDHPSARVGGA